MLANTLRRDFPQSPVHMRESPPGGCESDVNFWNPPPSFAARIGNSETVLVVDDDRDFLIVAMMRLEQAGFETICASDGDEAVDSATKFLPDAIVLDIRMPRMDGLTALRILRSTPSTLHIPVVMLSASLVDQHSALDAGARCFLKKPHNGQMLVTAIEHAIHERN